MTLDPLVLVGGRYSRVEYAIADLGRVRALHARLGLGADLDAAVISRTWDGRVDVVQTYEPVRRASARRGLGLGLAAGALVAVLPAVGLGAALLGAAGVGTAVGAAAGGRHEVLTTNELRELGALLARGASGLLVVTSVDRVDEVRAAFRHADEVVHRALRPSPEPEEGTT